MTEAFHVVCHTCDFEDVVEDDRVLAAAKETLHRKRAEGFHDVEYVATGEVPADG